MLAPQALMRGIVQRLLPSPLQDDRDNDRSVRFARYGEQYVQALVRKTHNLADEGTFFVTNNAQTGVVTSLLGAAFSATAISPSLIISNLDAVTPQARRVYIDQVHLVCTVAGAAASALTNLLFAWTIDNTDRYSSGGTELSPISPNMDTPLRASVCRVRFGALTLGAATAAVRTIVGQRLLRPQNSATAMCVAQDHFLMNFGGVEPSYGAQTDLTTAKTSGGAWSFPLPPIVLGPTQCAVLHLWSPGAALTTGITFLPELYWWER